MQEAAQDLGPFQRDPTVTTIARARANFSLHTSRKLSVTYANLREGVRVGVEVAGWGWSGGGNSKRPLPSLFLSLANTTSAAHSLASVFESSVPIYYLLLVVPPPPPTFLHSSLCFISNHSESNSCWPLFFLLFLFFTTEYSPMLLPSSQLAVFKNA